MRSPLHVLEVVPYYEPAWAFGGPPRVMSDEAKELVRRGHSVTVATTDALDADHRVRPSGISVEDGVEVRRYPNVSNRLAFHRYRFSPRGMRRDLRSLDVDVMHLSELRHELAVLAWREASRRDIPLAVSAHGTAPRRTGTGGRLRGLYDQAFVLSMVRGAAALFAQTSHEAGLYELYDVDPGRIHLVPLGVGLPPPPGDRPPDLGVPDDARVVLFLGRIHKLKGVERLIRAFASIAPEVPDAWLVIAGRDDGGEADARALATSLGLSGRISFPGPIYGNARYDAYRRATAFAITPIHFEETSLASLEAASVGTPLVVGEEAEAPFLDQYAAGRTTPAGADPAGDILCVLEGAGEAMGAAAERMIEEKHSWTRVGELVESIFVGVAR